MSGRTLSGQTNEAFWNSVRHAKPMAVGLNCALGAADMKPYVANLASCVDCYVLCYPNAGLPNAMGGYDQKGSEMAEEVRPFCEFFMILGDYVLGELLLIAALDLGVGAFVVLCALVVWSMSFPSPDRKCLFCILLQIGNHLVMHLWGKPLAFPTFILL